MTQRNRFFTVFRRNFRKYSESEANTSSPYDINSVMQYGGYDFGRNGKPTMIDKKTQKPVEGVICL